MHWKLMPHNSLVMGSRPPDKEQPRSLSNAKPMSAMERECTFQPAVTKQVPKFLRDFREAKKQGRLVGREAKAERDKCLGPGGGDGRPTCQPGGGPLRFGSKSLPSLLPSSDGDAEERPSTAPPLEGGISPPPSSWPASLGFEPRVVASTNMGGPRARKHHAVVWARSKAESDKISHTRKAYMAPQTIVKKPPKALESLIAAGSMEERCSTAPGSVQRSKMDKESHKLTFAPHRHFDFLTQTKALSLWNHYDMAGH